MADFDSTMAANETTAPVGGEGMAFQDSCVANSTEGLTCLPYGTNVSMLDETRLTFPFEGLDYVGCNEDLLLSDFDGNGQVSNDEYASFVAKTAARRCIEWPALNLGQRINFVSLACQCASHTHSGARPDCCIVSNAHVPTSGAGNALTRTEPQQVFLQNVCVVTYGTLPGTNCSIEVLPVATPPPITPFDQRAADLGSSDGNRWTLVAAMIATLLLLLLCCCCCCVLRRKRKKEYEEEEIIETEYPGKEEWLEQPLQEQAPRSMPPPPPPQEEEMEPLEPEPLEDEPSEYSGDGDNRGGEHEDDEESDGEGRARRGGNYVAEEDEDTKRRWGAGDIVDEDKDREVVQLKPIPAKEPPNEDLWDQPGRDIQELKPEPDEMSAQEFEPHIPDTGVHNPQRPTKDPVEWDNKWEKGKKPEDDEYDNRKHRIQAGMGEGEIWEKLDQDSNSKSTRGAGGGDAFDWVVQSAMNVIDTADEQGHLDGDDESTVPPTPPS